MKKRLRRPSFLRSILRVTSCPGIALLSIGLSALYARNVDSLERNRTGTGPKVCASFDNLRIITLYSVSAPDADNFYNSSFFDPNTKSGLGGWGDPSDDIQITTGAFASDFVLQYPVPHRIRRNYTAMSVSFGPDTEPITDPLYSFFTPQRVKDMVDGFPGDYVGFQELFEGGDGPHGALHQIVGGSVTLILFVISC